MEMNGVTQETYAAVVLRAGYTCEVCGLRPISQMHHRVLKGSGGTGVDWVDEPWNLLGICHLCHDYIHNRNRRKADEYGWIVSRYRHPGTVPVFVKGRCGRRFWVLLTRDGRYTETALQPA